MIPGSVVATVNGAVKHPAYEGRALLAVKALRRDGTRGATFLALDLIGAGIGDRVLVSRPTGLGVEVLGRRSPVRSYVVGILDP